MPSVLRRQKTAPGTAKWACAPLVLLGTASPWLVLRLPRSHGHLGGRHDARHAPRRPNGVAARRRLPPPPARLNRPPPDGALHSQERPPSPSPPIKRPQAPCARLERPIHHCHGCRARLAAEPHYPATLSPNQPPERIALDPVNLPSPAAPSFCRRSTTAPEQTRRHLPLSVEPPLRTTSAPPTTTQR